jgi:uncharacterized membrane protein (UPF0127 family)
MKRIFGVGLLAGCFAFGAARADYITPTGPQATLPTETLTIIDDNGQRHVFTVEVASTEAEQDTGEMFRTSIPANKGMIFPWTQPQISQMWMQNCPVPEDMVFIGSDGVIKAIAENTVPYSTATISSGVPVAATLELQGGLTATLNISVGDKVIAKQFGGG